MQDPDRIEEQIEELQEKAKLKADLTEQHRQIAEERKQLAELELTKFRALTGALQMAKTILQQTVDKLKQVEEPNMLHIQGHQAAVEQLDGLEDQASKAAATQEGAFNALNAMEETFRKKAVEAVSRDRGLEVQKERAVDLASRGAEEASAGDSAKEPMGTPQERDSASPSP